MNLMREAHKQDNPAEPTTKEPATTPRTTVRLAPEVKRNLQSADPVVRAVAASQLVDLAIPRVTRAHRRSRQQQEA